MDGRLFGDGCLLERGRLFEEIPFVTNRKQIAGTGKI